ncbi:hypothetical protein ABFT23_19405 [Nocardioides sp. C4-1]|uniref:hypothetical protein n=1 Tax=Nocardioides sp. C4-1 TaxID=3151851 RepID=UPI003264C9D6
MSRSRVVLVALVMAAAVAVGVGGGLVVAGTGDDAPDAGVREREPVVRAPEPQVFDVTLEVDACWVAAVEAGGRVWDLPVEQQFSAIAQNTPDDISGRGTATLDGPDDDTLDYVDADGGRLTFVPAGDPRTLQDRVCDATGP